MSRLLRNLNRLLLVAIAVFSAGAFVSINVLTQEQDRARNHFRENLTGLAFQVDYELLILIDYLDRFAEGDPRVDHDVLSDRFNVLWSRVDTNSTGQTGRYYLGLPGAEALIANLRRVLDDLEATVAGLESHDTASIGAVKHALRGLIEPVHAVTMESVMRQAALRGRMHDKHEELHRTLLVFLIIALLLGFGVIAILFLERRQLDLLSRTLEARVRERGEELRRAELRFRTLIAASPAEIFLRDTAGRFLLVNQAWEDRYGRREADVIGRALADILPATEIEHERRDDEEVLATARPLESEHTVTGDDEEVRSLRTVRYPIVDGMGAVEAIGGITTDVSEQRRAEAGLRRAQNVELVGRLTGGVAHDFNNLLAVVLGNAEMLARADEGDERVAAILRAGRRGAELTQRLLAFSRRQPLSPRAFDLAALVHGMTDLLTRTLGDTVRVEIEVTADLWPTVADPGQVESALLNLAINARDAMPAGGTLTLRCHNRRLDDDELDGEVEMRPGDYVSLAVIDDGSGMSAHDLSHAFEPFYTTKEVGAGSGLGLSMVYGFAKQSGGHVVLDSTEGEGTTVEILLPRAGPNDAGES